MTVREYIGARYIPLFIGEWDDSVSYEPLSVVTYEGNSYTSRQYVPIGIAIENETYWAATGNYNAQVEQYRQEVLTFDGRITQNTSDISAIDSIIPSSEFSSENTVKEYIDTEIGELSDSVESSISDILTTLEKIATVYNSLEEAIDNVTEEDYVIKTLSYYQNGNSGGAFYKVSQEIPDGYYETADSGVYLEIIEPDNVAQFGAKGDGSTNDTIAIQKAIDNLSIVNFEAGKIYKVSNLLIKDNNKILNGNKATVRNDDYQTTTLTHAINIGDSTMQVSDPSIFSVNQTAYIYNENSDPDNYQIVVTGINGNVISFKTYKPMRKSNDVGDTAPYYFPSGCTVYTGVTIFTIMAGMNAASSGIVKNVTISDFTIKQSTSFVSGNTWAQIAYGVIAYNTENFKFINNHVKGAAALFLMVYAYNKNVFVENNIFDDVSRSQAVCAHWDMVDISTNNRTHNFNVINNTFRNCPYSIIYSSVDGGLCSGNKIYNLTANNRLAIYLYGGDISLYTEYASTYTQEDFYTRNVIACDNIIENNVSSGAGFGVTGCKNCKIVNNDITMCGNAFGTYVNIDIDISNNTINHNYGYTSANDSAIRMYGKLINFRVHDNIFNCGRIVKIEALNKTISTGVTDPNSYWGYDDSTVFIENNYVTQNVSAPLIQILGTTETSHAPTQLKDVPKILMFNNNTVIQQNKQTLNIFNINSTLQSFITTFTNLIAQMYAYNNISYGLTMSYTAMNPYIQNSGNITMP